MEANKQKCSTYTRTCKYREREKHDYTAFLVTYDFTVSLIISCRFAGLSYGIYDRLYTFRRS